MKEKRHSVRWQVNLKAKLRLEGALADIPCVIHDLTFTGARISLAQKLPQDKPLKVNISLAEGFNFTAEIWVTWHKRIMEKNVYSVYFNQLSEADRQTIYKFIRAGSSRSLNKWQVAKLQGGEEKMLDRRIFERIPISLPVRLLDLENNQEIEAKTRDVSAKGLGILSGEYLNSGDRLELWLNMPDKREAFYSRGKVIWASHQETGRYGYRIGICLEKAELMGLSRIFRDGSIFGEGF